MNNFKVGDKVIRIGDSFLSHGLIKGNTYTVAMLSPDKLDVMLQEINSTYFLSSKFKKINSQLEFDFGTQI